MGRRIQRLREIENKASDWTQRDSIDERASPAVCMPASGILWSLDFNGSGTVTAFGVPAGSMAICSIYLQYTNNRTTGELIRCQSS